MKKALLLSFALCGQAFAFADWDTDAVPISSSPVIFTPDFKNSHDSHALDDGTIHVAYVTRRDNRDTLFYLKKNLYRNPGKITQVVQPIAVDTASQISAVQIRVCPEIDTIHFVYDRFEPLTPSSDIHFHSLHHTLYQPKPDPIFIRQSITSKLGSPYEISLEKTHVSGSRFPIVGVAYYTPLSNTEGTLSYASWSETNDWTTGVVDAPPNAQAGRSPDLAFASNGSPHIAYENQTTEEIRYATLTTMGLWLKSTVEGPADDGAASDPSLVLNEDGRHIVYVRKNALARRVILNRRFRIGTMFVTSKDTIDVRNSPVGTIFPGTFSNPKLVISAKRVVVSYNKSSSITQSIPWLASRRSDSFTFAKQTIPRLPGDLETLNGKTALTLDGHGYPIISWLANDDRGIRATYCPDWTDRDRDGVPYLQEKAFAMNPEVADIHLYPQQEVFPNASPVSRDLALVFTLPETATIEVTTQTITSGPFRYQPQHSPNLKFWSNDTRHFESSALNLTPPFPSSATIRTTAPIGDFEFEKQFLRVSVFRL